MERLHGSFQEQMSSRMEKLHGSIQDRLERLEKQFGQADERRTKDWEVRLTTMDQQLSESIATHGRKLEQAHSKWDQLHGRMATLEAQGSTIDQLKQNHAKRDAHHASMAERLEYVEKMLGDSADRHSQELKAAHQKLEQVHGRLSACERSHNTLTEQQRAREVNLDAHHATLKERVDYLEGAIGDSADRHSRELESLKTAHSRLQSDSKAKEAHTDAHHANVGERLSFLEKAIGSTVDGLKKAHANHVSDQTARDAHHATLAERLDYLERMFGDSADMHAKQLKAAHDKIEKIHARVASCEETGSTVADLHKSHQQVNQEHRDKISTLHSSVSERLSYLEGLMGESAELHARELEALKTSHSRMASEVKARDAHHATVSQRLDYIEKLLGDSADKHAQELRAAHSKIDQVHQRESLRALLHSEKEARQKHVATVEERLERLETSLGETHSKHALEIESTKAAHQRLSKEQKLRDDKHATVAERLEYLETKIGDSFDQHERELKAAHAKLEQAQNRILQCEKQGATISELHRSHSSSSQEHKAALAAHTASLGERLEFLEKSLGQSVEKHAKEVEALKVSHSKFATDTKLRATVSERLDYVEKMVGDSADKHAKELAAAHDKIKARGNHVDFMRKTHEKMANEQAHREQIHARLNEERQMREQAGCMSSSRPRRQAEAEQMKNFSLTIMENTAVPGPAGSADMAVDLEQVEQLGSPTELAEESDMEHDADVKLEPKVEKEKTEKSEKRKREIKKARPDAQAQAIPDDSDEDLGSPSKKAHGDDRPISARELRELLVGHRDDMKQAWQAFEDRLGRVELQQKNQVGDIASLAGRTKINEKDISSVKKAQTVADKKIESITAEVANLKVQFEEQKQAVQPPAEGAHPGGGVGADPWADYYNRQLASGRIGNGQSSNDRPNPAKPSTLPSGGGEGDFLSEDDRKTLVVGGWLQDTRRATIEEESKSFLEHPEVKPLVDVEKLAIFGPRRSVGMLKFCLRDGEKSLDEVKNRMWKVVKAASQLRIPLESAKNMGEDRAIWCSFVKTKQARTRSAHISMARRVTMALAAESKNEEGGVLNYEHTTTGAYDMDWNAGTIWSGLHKLASSTHRSPKDAEIITMTGGWINLDAVGLIAGCTVEAAKAAFEKELRKWGRCGSWNLGGQKIDLLDVAGRDLDIVLAQEVSRGEVGWDTTNTELFHWVHHQSPRQWRGVAIGIAHDKLDSVIHRVSTSRGIWLLARLKGLGRVAIGALHCHTGATNAIYQAAVLQFTQECPGRWRQYPLICGIDANEELKWMEGDDCRISLRRGSTNLELLSHQMLHLGACPIGPTRAQWECPSHFPRDETRVGRQIDGVWSRLLDTNEVRLDAERRHVIGTDHALVYVDLFSNGKSQDRWGRDSRPRYLCADIPSVDIQTAADLAQVARACTCPRKSLAYEDTDEIKDMIREARITNEKKDWKRVHKARRTAKRAWEQQRLSNILHGDWHQYRALQREKKRRTGWWGKMLQNQSASDNTEKVKAHLSSKLVNEFGKDWDELLQMQIDAIETRSIYQPFTMIEVREVLQDMKVNSAVGPDGISVSFLRHAMSHDIVAPLILDLINNIIEWVDMPDNWEDNFLALLAKVDYPEKPGDLRPICVSSAFHKLINKLVCTRALPSMRIGSRISGCGKGRQAADIIGTMTRLRDLTQEWDLPILLCKLDISGAFDKLDRQKVVELLRERLGGGDLDHELKYLMAQLRTYKLTGKVPGGGEISLSPNIGIKQGAPESAEVFGLVMDAILTQLIEHAGWKAFGRPLPGLDVELVFYQDDIFLIETNLGRLGKRVKVLERCLLRHGLNLAPEKTKIVASSSYRGARRALVGGTFFSVADGHDSVRVLGISFNLQDSASQQAREILQRTRGAAMCHKELLRGRASWERKANMIGTLVESQFTWTGGALHWSPEDLRQANTLQLHVLRSAFRIARTKDETWADWNTRSMRLCRAWLAAQGRPRWSARLLTLQHTLLGHWARMQETLGPDKGAIPCLPMRAFQWRSTAWWRKQQQLTPRTGVRHPRRVYISNVEQMLAATHGCEWPDLAQNRQRWTACRQEYLNRWDPKWCRGRQLALQN
ncbi:unnamed protein product [Symbiodinium sp. CCMP2592]|nr:unnamed protein product [Symbiodinium sp. CCMP2592]